MTGWRGIRRRGLFETNLGLLAVTLAIIALAVFAFLAFRRLKWI